MTIAASVSAGGLVTVSSGVALNTKASVEVRMVKSSGGGTPQTWLMPCTITNYASGVVQFNAPTALGSFTANVVAYNPLTGVILDTGTVTVTGSAASSFSTKLDGDAYPRLQILSDGTVISGDGTSAPVANTVEVFDVSTFGADSTGVTDSTTAVAAAYAAAAANSKCKTVLFPPGTYTLSGSVGITVAAQIKTVAYGATITWASGTLSSVGMFTAEGDRNVFEGGRYVIGASVTGTPLIISTSGTYTESSGIPFSILVKDFDWEGNNVAGAGGFSATGAIYRPAFINGKISQCPSAAISMGSNSTRYPQAANVFTYASGALALGLNILIGSVATDCQAWGGTISTPTVAVASASISAVRVSRCRVGSTLAATGITAGFSAENCYVTNVTPSSGTATGISCGNTNGSVITGNRVDVVTAFSGLGTGLLCSSSATSGSNRVTNNSVSGVTGPSGAQCLNLGTAAVASVVTGNTFIGWSDVAIAHASTGRLECANNILDINAGAGAEFIYSTGATQIYSGNTLIGANSGATVGIQVQSTTAGAVVSDNRFIDIIGHNVHILGGDVTVNNNHFSSSFSAARSTINNGSTGTVNAISNRVDNASNFSSGTYSGTVVALGGPLVASSSTENKIVNTSALSDLVAYTIPANTVKAGDVFDLEAWGRLLNTSGANRTYTFNVALGASTSETFATGAVGSSALESHWRLRLRLVVGADLTTHEMAGEFTLSSNSFSTSGDWQPNPPSITSWVNWFRWQPQPSVALTSAAAWKWQVQIDAANTAAWVATNGYRITKATL